MKRFLEKFNSMKMENKLLLLALVCGLLAGVSGYLFMSYKEKALMKSMEPVQILVASKFINPKTRISEDMVKTAALPGSFVTSAHVKEFKQLKGRITLVPFLEGEPLLLNKLSEKADTLSSAVPNGLRAVAVAVDEESSAGYLIKPGDYVDVLLTYEAGPDKRNGTVTATFLQSIQVVAAGTALDEGGQDKKYNTISLAVTAEEAEVLVFAGARGRITFSLRPVGETEKENLKSANFDEFLKQIKSNEKKSKSVYQELVPAVNLESGEISKRGE